MSEQKRPTLELSGERFRAIYDIKGTADEAAATAEEICIEQTIEFPPDLVRRQDILQGIIAEVVSLEARGDDLSRATVEFPLEVAGGELPQLLNALFGNISLRPGIRLVDLELPPALLRWFRGPRFGRRGLREALGVHDRPLIASALKPMGLSPGELAELAAAFVEGGVDIIKDDHGLANQSFCPYEERVRRCAEAVTSAAARRGRPCLYFANATGPARALSDNARIAREAGAAGVVLAPGLAGFDAMAELAVDDELELMVMSHPSLLGSFTASRSSGIAQGVLYGLLNRLAGADVAIFPNAGGRFTFTERDCRDIVAGCERELPGIAASLPAPAGGMSVGRIGEMVEFYGREVILLIGGDLHRHGATVADGARKALEQVTED